MHVRHGEIVNGDVFQNAAVHFFQAQAAATAEGAVRHRAVAEAAAGLRTELDAAITVSRGLHRAVQQRAFHEAGNLAVDDGQVFGDPCLPSA